MKKSIFLIALSLIICPVFGQYVTDFQAVYPFNKGANSTKNYTFTKDNSLISPTLPGYMLMANSSINSSIALAALKLNADFSISSTLSFVPVTTTTWVSIVPLDLISNSDGSYVVCGTVSYSLVRYAFIAAFDAKANPLWYKEYPEITRLNAIINVANSATDKISYMACGTYGSSYPVGIILAVDSKGIPVWYNCTVPNGKSDKFEYNDLISINNQDVALLKYAVVGNAITDPYTDKNVLVTCIDINGNVYYSYLYGLINTSSTIYDEEGYGLTLSDKNEIVISGRTKCYFVQLPAIKYDDALLFAITKEGKIDWCYRYDIPKNSAQGEYAQKVLDYKENLYVSGYYISYNFLNSGSYDGFAFETDLTGIPTGVRVYGNSGADLFYAQEINHAYNGLISVGFSSSFFSSSTAGFYAPYIVESYRTIEEPCYSLSFKLPYEKAELEMSKIGNNLTTTKYLEVKLKVVENPVYELVVCPKKSIVSEELIEAKAVDETALSMVNKVSDKLITLYPNPVQSILTIEGAESGSSYKIFSITGNILTEGTLNNKDVDVANLSGGVYYISIINNHFPVTIKFIKE